MSSSTARWLYFGNFAQIDTDETNYSNENFAAVLATSTGPTLRPIWITGNDTDNSGVIVSDDNGQTQETFSYDLGSGPMTVGYDAEAVVSIKVTLGDGTSYTANVTLYQMDNGDVFLFEPDVFDYQKIQSVEVTAQISDNYYGTTAPLTADGNVDVTDIVCFCSGTLIRTPQGDMAVEALRPGDLVTTADHGNQPLRWIGRRRLGPADLAIRPELAPVRIAAGALGNGLPQRDLCVSPQHRVLVASPIAARMFGEGEVLVAARHLGALPGVSFVAAAAPVNYVHLLFDRHEVVFSEGAATESLHTGPWALRALGGAAEREIAALFPELGQSGTNAARALARPVLPGRFARSLVRRHGANARQALQPRASA